MKKIALLTAGLVLGLQASAIAWGFGGNDQVISSGYKTASVQISSVPCTVYGFVGLNKTANGMNYLVDGTATDSGTVGYQAVLLYNIADEAPLNYAFPQGVKFPRGCYLNVTPKAGAGGATANANGTVYYSVP